MPLSLNEIRKRATVFSKEWEGVTDERAEAQSFWNEFFNVFGVSRRRVANFEKPIKKVDGRHGYIDLLWKGIVLVEHKSTGKDLNTAYKQAKDYFPGLTDEELPRYIIVSNFRELRLYDLEIDTQTQIPVANLYKNINLFGFLSGYQQKVYKDQEPVNIKAAELMGGLHDTLLANGYEGHELEVMLVRILFCLFAEDTTIFEKQQFAEYIELRTKEDGSDLGLHLAQLFEVLNTPTDERARNLDEQIAAFPYVNGSLYREQLHFASFDSAMRKKVLTCCYFDWSQISPAIFGSMFQSVMNPKERRNLGAHYTSEKNIIKLIKGLFLDELWSEFDSIKNDNRKLKKFQERLASLKFLDPACGCGNFLIITYRELRLLELEILKILFKGQLVTDVTSLSQIDVDAFYGIEYEEFAAQIAIVAMWLIDHQMNIKLSTEFGEYFKRLPLRKSATIVHGNALQIKWEEVIPKGDLSYILGNPPFVGSKLMDENQRNDLRLVFDQNIEGAGILDYVSGWYYKACEFIQGTSIGAAFVSTNSICQGEQVGVLWSYLLKQNLQIKFAHKTFKWNNEAKGNAAVYVVIIGFYDTLSSPPINKCIYDYPDIKGEPLVTKVKNINPYLVEGPNVVIAKRSNPISNIPKINFGNMPLDGGHLIFSDEEMKEFISKEPNSLKYFKPLLSAKEFLNNQKRWCLWLVDAKPNDLKKLPLVLDRIEKVKTFRLASVAPSTRKFASTPSLFRDRNEPDTFILIPRHSSENRKYIPLGFFTKDSIASDSCMAIPNGTVYHFGILQSEMHMIWIKYVCGRIKSDFRYSKDIVYNNFPWPNNISKLKVSGVEKYGQQILKVRQRYPESSLSDLYDPLTMPEDLVRAHEDLDRFVDTCYRPQGFHSEIKRIEFLFDLYKQYTQPLFGAEKKTRKRKAA